LFLIATATYIFGSGLLDSILNAPDYLSHVSPKRAQVVLGVLLQYGDAAAVAAIGIVLFPILRKHNEVIALGYAGTRIIECLLLIGAGIGSLSLIKLSQGFIQAGSPESSSFQELGNLVVAQSGLAFQVAMIALGLGSMPFCYLLYRSRLIPRAMAVLGFVGYAALFIGGVFELFGLNLSMVHYLPGGLFELVLPIWLIVKGFTSPAIASDAGIIESRAVGVPAIGKTARAPAARPGGPAPPAAGTNPTANR